MAVVEVKLAHAHPLQTAIFGHPLGGVVPGRALQVPEAGLEPSEQRMRSWVLEWGL